MVYHLFFINMGAYIRTNLLMCWHFVYRASAKSRSRNDFGIWVVREENLWPLRTNYGLGYVKHTHTHTNIISFPKFYNYN